MILAHTVPGWNVHTNPSYIWPEPLNLRVHLALPSITKPNRPGWRNTFCGNSRTCDHPDNNISGGRRQNRCSLPSYTVGWNIIKPAPAPQTCPTGRLPQNAESGTRKPTTTDGPYKTAWRWVDWDVGAGLRPRRRDGRSLSASAG